MSEPRLSAEDEAAIRHQHLACTLACDERALLAEIDRLRAALAARDRQLAELRAMIPLLDKAGQGDREQQAMAWVAVHHALVEVGLESFIDSISDCGAVRAVKFIRHLGKLAALLPPTPKEDDRAAKE